MRHLVLPAVMAVGALAARQAQEPPARQLPATHIPLSANLATISGVRELRDGRLVLSDAKRAAVYLADAATHTMTQIGSAGGDELQYAQPGGFYAAPADSTFLLDRGLAKILVLSPNGAIAASRSIKRRGVSSSSDDDVDRQRVDSRGLAYFTMRAGRFAPSPPGAKIVDSVPLVRFDAVRQHADTVAFLREAETRVTRAEANFQMTQAVYGAPADEWGVAADGRVAVVRASPYRVEWHTTDGHVTRGPAYTVPAIAFADAEKDSILARSKASASSVGMVGGPTTSSADQHQYFADAKAPFAANDVAVSPSGEVWVARTQPFGVSSTVYDVFDRQGNRVDRVQLAGSARVIGFGTKAVYAVIRERGGQITLAKYSR